MARGHEQRSADMSDQDRERAKEEAKQLGARAARQSQAAAKNTGRAAKRVAPVIADTVGDAAETVNDAAEEAVAQAKMKADRFTTRMVAKTGVLGLSFVPSTRIKLYSAAALSGLGLVLTMRYFALDSVERAFAVAEAERLAKLAATDV